MENTEKKELVIIPEKKVEPNQESITQTYNEILFIAKAILLTSLIILIYTLISSLIGKIL